MIKGAIIGKNINYSKSPALYNYYFNKNNIKASFEIINLKTKELKSFITSNNFDFFNITQPYKEEILRYVEAKSLIVNKVNNTNLVIKKNNKLYAYNSDYYGLNVYNKVIKNAKNILIIGRGSVAKTTYIYLKDNFNINIFLSSPRNNYISNFFYCKHIKMEEIKNYSFDTIIYAASHLGEKLTTNFKINSKSIINLNYQSNMLENYCNNKNIKYLNGKKMLVKQFLKNIELIFQS